MISIEQRKLINNLAKDSNVLALLKFAVELVENENYDLFKKLEDSTDKVSSKEEIIEELQSDKEDLQDQIDDLEEQVEELKENIEELRKA
jgi:peptidoglycan hydrolase CwlO-like protein